MEQTAILSGDEVSSFSGVGLGGPGVVVVVGLADESVPGGAGQDDRPRWVVGVGGQVVVPATFVLQAMIMSAFGVEVLFTGGAGGVAEEVVEVGGGGRAGA